MIYTLTDIAEEYLAERHIQKKKYLSSYLIHSKWAWKDIFFKTLYSTISMWQEVKNDGENYYIDMPEGVLRLFSISDVDEQGNVFEIFYNNKMNVVSKQNAKCCSCGTSCDCGGACEDINSMVVTTKYLFSQNGIDYYQKDWIQYCKNGEVIQWSEVPAKKYNDIIGDTGDYNNDYNNDYNQPIFSNYEIVVEKFQTKLCTLSALPCGCPADTEQNEDAINKFCSCFKPTWRRHRHTDLKTDNINSNCRGTVKLSPCGTKIIYMPHKHNKKIPSCLQVNFQTNGESSASAIIIPEYAVDCVKFGIDYRYKWFNNTFSSNEKREAKYAFEEKKTDIIIFRNQLSLEWLGQVQDAEILW